MNRIRALLLLVTLTVAGSAMAQAPTETNVGVATDPTRAAVAGARVSITNRARACFLRLLEDDLAAAFVGRICVIVVVADVVRAHRPVIVSVRLSLGMRSNFWDVSRQPASKIRTSSSYCFGSYPAGLVKATLLSG